MAAQQEGITSMSGPARGAQEQWAQGLIQRAMSTLCPQGHAWIRVHDGYHCKGKHHYITDSLLAEGRGGMLWVPGGAEGLMDLKWGPYYLDHNDRGRLFYAGDPRLPCPQEYKADFRGDWQASWRDVWRVVPDLKGPPFTRSDAKRVERKIAEIYGKKRYRITAESLNYGAGIVSIRRKGAGTVRRVMDKLLG